MAKVKLALRDMPVPEKVQFGRQVVTAMTGNAVFTTPVPALTLVTTKINDLETKYNTSEAARIASKQATALSTFNFRVAELVRVRKFLKSHDFSYPKIKS